MKFIIKVLFFICVCYMSIVKAQKRVNSLIQSKLNSISLITEFNYHRSLIIGNRYIEQIVPNQTTSALFYGGYTKVPTYSFDGACSVSFETKKNIIFRTGIYVYDRKRVYQIDSIGFKKLLIPHNYLYYDNRNIEFGIPILIGYQFKQLLAVTGLKIKTFGLFNKYFYYESKPILTSKLAYMFRTKKALITPTITIDIAEKKYLDIGFGLELVLNKKMLNEKNN